MKFIAIIPARFASTRFPGKPLVMLGGKPIVQHVYDRVSKIVDETYVATDDERIRAAVEAFGGKVVMTSPHHPSGTDRCFEAYNIIKESADIAGKSPNATNGGDVVINVQGDEPFIDASQLREVMACFDLQSTDIATLVKPFTSDAGLEALKNPNSPKVVIDSHNKALYFSRSVIPYLRNVPESEWLSHHTFYKHIGLYAYRADVLRLINSLPQSPLERAESLEQLRWLEAGLKISVGITHVETIGIDTPEDLERAEQFLAQTQS